MNSAHAWIQGPDELVILDLTDIPAEEFESIDFLWEVYNEVILNTGIEPTVLRVNHEAYENLQRLYERAGGKEPAVYAFNMLIEIAKTGLTMDEYQRETLRTSLWAEAEVWDREAVTATALSLAGEAGELANKIKKRFYHGEPIPNAEIEEEIGDALWYIADLARTLGCRLSDVAERNLDKLRRRWPDGFKLGQRRDDPGALLGGFCSNGAERDGDE